MDISTFLNGTQAQSLVRSVSQQLNLDENQASSAINMAIPVILAGLTKNAQSPEGAQSLNNALESKHDGSLLNNMGSLLDGNLGDLFQDGNNILGHIFGGNKSGIEQGISKKTGLSMDKIAPLLALLAPIVMAYLGKQKRQTNTQAGGLGDLLSGMLSGGTPSKGGSIMDLVTGMIDKDKDGNVLDDLVGGFFRK